MRRLYWRLFTTFLLCCNGPALWANHIVGGEIELIYQGSFNYQLRLIQYFDDAQTANTTPDPNATLGIFSKATNELITTVTLFLNSNEDVSYSNPACARGDLQTDRLLYAASVFLAPEIYNDPAGYYVVWSRCCRNGAVGNIVDPLGTGMTYYLEFPAVVDAEGEPFQNSSPQLFPPLSDYACANSLYYVDFRGSDPDGDSLVYSLATPLATTSSVPIPPPEQAPHPLVQWAPGISLNNSVPGNPSLRVDSAGFLTLVPSQQGLFVFGIKVDEFRDGVKIGEVRRDFQLLVVGNCTPTRPPTLTARTFGDPATAQPIADGDTLVFEFNEAKCFVLQVSDPDAPEQVIFRARPRNFGGGDIDVFDTRVADLITPTDTIESLVCLDNCPQVDDGPMLIDFIALDETCALPRQDTITLAVIINGPPNEPPAFVTPTNDQSFNVLEGTSLSSTIVAEDPDLDPIFITPIPDGWDLADFNIDLRVVDDQPGRLELEFVWDTSCDLVDFSNRTEFPVTFVVQDLAPCNFAKADTLDYTINITLPFNSEPTITTDLSPINEVSVSPGEVVQFNVLGNDADNDPVTITAVGRNFDLPDFNIDFTTATGTGQATAPFTWVLGCFDFGIDPDFEETYLIDFIIEDADRCELSNTDTVTVAVNVGPTENQPPVVSIQGNATNNFDLTVNTPLTITVVAQDAENDTLVLFLREVVGVNAGSISFPPVRGVGRVEQTLTFTPDCTVLPQDGTQTFSFEFVAQDERCLAIGEDNLVARVTVEDIPTQDDGFLPANVFSPNGDGINDSWFVRDLPEDNCFNRFESVAIYNRWGRQVFFSEARDFEWRGNDLAVGVYFYFINYSITSYKGTVTILE